MTTPAPITQWLPMETSWFVTTPLPIKLSLPTDTSSIQDSTSGDVAVIPHSSIMLNQNFVVDDAVLSNFNINVHNDIMHNDGTGTYLAVVDT